MNKKYTEIITEELNHWKNKGLFTLGDKETIKMLKTSFKRISEKSIETFIKSTTKILKNR